AAEAAPAPEPEAEPAAEAEPAPEPEAEAAPAPEPMPAPMPSPMPEVAPEPVAASGPEPVAASEPVAAHAPEPEPETVATPAPEPETAPTGPTEPAEVAEQPESPEQPAGGFSLEGVLARLKTAEPKPAAAPAPAPGPTPSPSAPPTTAKSPPPAAAPQSARAEPSNVKGYAAFREGYRAAAADKQEHAVALYTAAIESGALTLEHLADALFNRANALHYLKRYDDAIADYDAAIRNKPGFADAYYNRGFAHKANQEPDRAVEDFRMARDLGMQRLGVRAPDAPPPLP
ncbi:MAG: tetratricopeptide repeat protein, partial [Kiloniellaceae bacterium]